MENDFKDVGSRGEEKLEQLESLWEVSKNQIIHYGTRVWSTLALVAGIAGTIMLAHAVQANPQHLSLMGKPDNDIPEVFDLVYKVASSTDQTVFAVINDRLFNVGIDLVILAFLFQFLAVWGGDIFILLRKGYIALSDKWK